MTNIKNLEEKIEKEKIRIPAEISKIESEIDNLEQDKYAYKRKEDLPAIAKVNEKQKRLISKKKSLLNIIPSLEKELEILKIEEKQKQKTISQMNKFLNEIKKGKNRAQASKLSKISLSKVSRWISKGKLKNDDEFQWFYEKIVFYENYYMSFFYLLKKEFTDNNFISLSHALIPNGENNRLDRYYNTDSNLWFSRLKISSIVSIYYFGLKNNKFPSLILIYNNSSKKSNFRLHQDELLIYLKINKDFKLIKNKYRLLRNKKDKNNKMFYITLGNLNEINISHEIEKLIVEFGQSIENPFLKEYGINFTY